MTRGLLAGSIAFLGAAILIGSAMISHAGPLDPPLGPVAPSYKTLSEVEPRVAINAVNTPGDANSIFKITAPGSYYLTGNVQGVAGKHGIEIAASHVTVDLNGFQLVGVGTSLCGVVSSSSHLMVHNGILRQWGGEAIAIGDQVIVEKIQVVSNIGDGILTGGTAQVLNCTVTGSNRKGIVTGITSQVVNCSVSGCFGVGIEVFGSTVSGCQVGGNAVGMKVFDSSAVLDCHAHNNTGDGIVVAGRALVRGNISTSNGTNGTGIGIRVTATDVTLIDNVCLLNDYGISVEGTGNIITNNRCSGNTKNYDIVAGNRYGPIMNLTPTNGAAASGDSAATNLNTTDPWANFAY